MAFAILPRKNYRSYDGRLVTEYEALAEVLKSLEAKRQALEDHIELLRHRLATAEGHPGPHAA